MTTNSGKLLTALLTWLLLSPAFRLRKFCQGNKQGLLTPGGLALTLSFFFSLMRNVTFSVALGYHSVVLCVVPQLLNAAILAIFKCVADKEFRRWSLSDQVLYALIGSLVPSITPRFNPEDQNGSHLPRTHITDTENVELTEKAKRSNEIDAITKQYETDAMLDGEDEPNGANITGEQTGEPNVFVMKRRSTSKELLALVILHAVSVFLGAAYFFFLHETSTQFFQSEIKVKDASRIDLMLAVCIGCPAALLASIVFRAIHNKLGPWRAID